MLNAFTRDGRQLARQIMDQYPDNQQLALDLSQYVTAAALATTLTEYATTADLAQYVSTSALETILDGYVSTAALASELANYATVASLSAFVTTASLAGQLANYATTASLAAYVSTTALTAALASYVLTSALSAYVTTASLTATLASYATQAWVQARTWISTQLTNGSGIATFATVAGQFSSAPRFVFSVQAGSGASGVYNVQQNGPAVESGSPGARVYTVQAKVSLSLAVTVLSVSVLGVQAAPSSLPVICMAHV